MQVDFLMAGEQVQVKLERKEGDQWQVQVGERSFILDYARLSPQSASLLIDDRSLTAHVSRNEEDFYISIGGRRYQLQMPEQDSSGRGEVAAAGGSGSIQTPMPGLIVEVMVKPEEEVTAGTTLVILEAMKMENAVKAPFDGVVKSVNVAKGDQANLGDVLVELVALEEEE